MKLRKVILIEQEIPHYRVGIFDALNQALDNLLTVYSPENDPTKYFIESSEVNPEFKKKHISGKWVLGGRIFLSNYFKVLIKEGRPDVLIIRHVVRNPFTIPFLIFCRAFSIPTVVWGQGFSRKRTFRPWLNFFDFLNFSIVKLSNAYAAYTPMVKSVLGDFVDSRKISVATNTINLRHLDAKLLYLKKEGKDAVKARLNLQKKQYLLFIGRLQNRKRIDFLLQAFGEILKSRDDIGLIIIGDGPERERLENQAAEFSNESICFCGALNFEQAADWLFSADVMVVPGWLGLAVNHGFYFGLPVVTCDRVDSNVGHPPEIEWLENKVTGVISKAQTASMFSEDILYALDNAECLGSVAKKYYEKYLLIDKMVMGFEASITIALSRRKFMQKA